MALVRKSQLATAFGATTALLCLLGATPAASAATVAQRPVGSDPLTGAHPQRAAPSSAHFRPGAAGVGDPYFPLAGNGGYDVRRYLLDLSYDPASKHLDGVARISARATQDLSRFDLDLSGLEVRAVTVDGRPARFSRSGQELVVTPAHGLRKRSAFHVTVRYDGTPGPVTDPDGSLDGWIPTKDGAFVAGEPQGAMTWFPSNNHPSDKATYTFHIAVPDGVTVVANGVLRSRTDTGSGTTFTWKEREPMASYLATATLGRFDLATRTTDAGLPVYLAVDPALPDSARQTLAETPDIVAWESSVFGPYPFSATGGIADDASFVGYALETQTKPLYDRAPSEGTLVHELAHQWYGDSVTLGSWQDIWLHEGFATYVEWLWSEHQGKRTAAEAFDHYYATPASNTSFWNPPPGEPGDGAHIFDGTVYTRGAMTLQALRERVGDKAFFTILREWAAQHRYGNATTADFVSLAEKVSDQDLGHLFDVWLYRKGKPQSW